MKIIVYFVILTLATIMVMYNHKAFIELTKVIKQVDSISSMLETRGRQRYLLQKHLTIVLSSNSYSAEQFNELKDSKVLDSSFGQSITASDYPDLIDWNKKQQAENYLDRLISQYPLERPQDIMLESSFSIEGWTYRMVDTLDQIQQQNILLASRLNNLMTSRLAKTVSINISLVASIFLMVLFYNYKRNKHNIAKTNELNESLLSREKTLISSKKVLISLMEDLSQEKNAALKLTRMFKSVNQKLKVKHTDMEQFIYTVSHDLKAPLVTIGSFSETLYQQLKPSLDDKQNHKFVRIKENINEMQNLLADLLEISRVMTQTLEKSSINTRELIDSVLLPLEELIKANDSQVTVCEPILDLFGNPRLIGLCITNLVSNAIRHRDLQRKLVVDISTEMTSEGVKLNVRDNAIGIDSNDFERVFKVFERLSDREGSGVGLAIVKAVIDKHDGIIQLDSTKGKGSTFGLTFPFANS